MAQRRRHQHSDDTLAELPVDYSFRKEELEPQEPEEQEIQEELAPPPLPDQESLEVPGEGAGEALAQLEQAEDDYLNEIEDFLMEEMVERQAQERIDRMAEKIRVHVTTDFETLDQDPVEEVKPLWAEPEDLIHPEIQLEEDAPLPPQDYRPLWLYWAIGLTAAGVVLALIYIVSR